MERRRSRRITSGPDGAATTTTSAQARSDPPRRTPGPTHGAPARDREDASSTGPNPYVFIVGCPRSGTTLLKRMVDAHPGIAITPETHWIPRCFRKEIGVTPDGLVTDELVPALLDYYKFGNLRLNEDDVRSACAADEPVTYAAFVSRIFDLFARRSEKTLAGDKTPGYVQEIPLLHDLWPGAKFVHLIRDGRDVCLSMLDWGRAPRTAGRYVTWSDDPVSTTAMWWERFVRLGREDGSALGPSLYFELRYEDLVADAASACERLCRFLDLPFDEAMVTFHEGRRKPARGRSAKGAWLPVTPGIRDWRSQMPADDLERFETVSGALLDDLDYERGVPSPSQGSRDAAAAIRQRFAADPRLRRRRLPTDW